MDASLQSGNVNRAHLVRWRSSGSALLGTNVVPRKQIRSDKAVDIPPTGTVSSRAAPLQLGELDPASNLSFPLCYTCITLWWKLIVDILQAVGSGLLFAVLVLCAGGVVTPACPSILSHPFFHPAFNLLARCMD